MAQIMEKHIATTMDKLRAHAEHAGRKTVKIRDLKMLNVQSWKDAGTCKGSYKCSF